MKTLSTDAVVKAHKKHQAELEAVFGDVAAGLDMSGGKAKVIPRMMKKQGEYFDFKYGEVQEAWVRGREAVGRTPKRKVDIQKIAIPEG